MVLSRGQTLGIVGAGSLLVHVGLANAVKAIPSAPRVTKVVVAVRAVERPKKVEPPPPPKPAPEVAAPAPPAPKAAPAKAPPPDAPAPAKPAVAAAAPVDLGLTLGNGGGPGGVAVPVAGPVAPTAAPSAQPSVVVAPKALGPATAGCTDPPTRPKPLLVLQPAYTEAARTAGVEGKVRVEIVVDPTGRVVSAKVLQGLGHGLDEAALAAAKGSSFAPAERCGEKIAATFVVGMRFSL